MTTENDLIENLALKRMLIKKGIMTTREWNEELGQAAVVESLMVLGSDGNFPDEQEIMLMYLLTGQVKE